MLLGRITGEESVTVLRGRAGIGCIAAVVRIRRADNRAILPGNDEQDSPVGRLERQCVLAREGRKKKMHPLGGTEPQGMLAIDPAHPRHLLDPRPGGVDDHVRTGGDLPSQQSVVQMDRRDPISNPVHSDDRAIIAAGCTEVGCVPGSGAAWACAGAIGLGGGAAEAVVVPGAAPPGSTTTRVPTFTRV